MTDASAFDRLPGKSVEAPQLPRLLFVACSQRKRPSPGLLPAIDRYDGPAFRVLRKFLREHPEQARCLDIFVLSAKFGLIPGYELIPDYDERMSRRRAEELRSEVQARARDVFTYGGPYRELFIYVGRDYNRVLEGCEVWRPPDLKVRFAQGPLGTKLAALRDWLHGDQPPMPPHRLQGRARLRGVQIRMKPQEVMEAACQALIEGRGDPSSYQAWYVEVEGKRVAPKWLVSQLTGLHVSTFTTAEALRVLTQLGIEVVRCE